MKFALVLAIVTGACLFPFTFPVFAEDEPIPLILFRSCNLSTLQSSYGVQATGTFVSLPSFPSGPFGQTGVIIFQGNGKMSVKDTISLNGAIASRELTGTYTVQPNCEVSLSITENQNSAVLKGVIVNQGKKILFIQAEPGGVVITGSAEKIF